MHEPHCQKNCCLFALVFGLVGVAFIGFLAFLAIKVLPVVIPKMMNWMMPKMISFMEEAEVEPPCAQILKRYYEEQKQEAQSA